MEGRPSDVPVTTAVGVSTSSVGLTTPTPPCVPPGRTNLTLGCPRGPRLDSFSNTSSPKGRRRIGRSHPLSLSPWTLWTQRTTQYKDLSGTYKSLPYPPLGSRGDRSYLNRQPESSLTHFLGSETVGDTRTKKEDPFVNTKDRFNPIKPGTNPIRETTESVVHDSWVDTEGEGDGSRGRR